MNYVSGRSSTLKMDAVRSAVLYPEMEAVSFLHFYLDDGGCVFLRNGTYLYLNIRCDLPAVTGTASRLKTEGSVLTQQG